MQFEWMKFVLEKLRKISNYEYSPKTDEQYLSCRTGLLKQIKRAYENLARTSDKKYLAEIKRARKKLTNIVSQTEYEQCKKIVKEYKACYGNIIDERLWSYNRFKHIYDSILVDGYESLEEAVADYKEELKLSEELKRYMELNGINDYKDPRLDEFLKKILENNET